MPFARAVAVASVGLVLNVAPTPSATRAENAAQPARPADASHLPQPVAPDFTRMDLQGHSVRLSSYRGKVVLLTFWASWCEPCRAEAPKFSTWEKRYYARGLRILGVSMDDDAASAITFADALKLSYPSVMGDEQLGQLYGGVMGLPLAFLIDSHGRIVARYRGEPDMDRLRREIEALLDVT